jgi:hypothetical protein
MNTLSLLATVSLVHHSFVCCKLPCHETRQARQRGKALILCTPFHGRSIGSETRLIWGKSFAICGHQASVLLPAYGHRAFMCLYGLERVQCFSLLEVLFRLCQVCVDRREALNALKIVNTEKTT